jgi:multidrug efflux pump
VGGAEISVEPERNGPPVGKPINIEITGDDYATLATLSTQLLKVKLPLRAFKELMN